MIRYSAEFYTFISSMHYHLECLNSTIIVNHIKVSDFLYDKSNILMRLKQKLKYFETDCSEKQVPIRPQIVNSRSGMSLNSTQLQF